MLKFPERIKKIIELVGSAEKLANISGMSSRVIGQYLAGKSEPSRIKLIALADAAQVNIEWLATGNGPMTTDDTPKYDEDFLRAVIEASESYWIREGKELSPSEKADMIISVYSIAHERDRSKETTEIEELIKSSEMWDTMMNTAVERMSDSVNGEKFRIGFEKHLKRIFKGAYKKKGGLQFFIDELIGSYVIRKHMKEGTLKFPTKDEKQNV